MRSAALAALALLAAGRPPADVPQAAPPDLQWRALQRCGPNCLYVVLFMYGKQADYDVLVSKMNLTSRGVSAADLVRVADEFGVPLAPLRTDASDLPELPLPAIVHFRIPGDDGGHFVVLLSVNSDDTFTIIECTRGELERLSKGDFLDRWSGVVLVRADRWDDGTLDAILLAFSILLLLLLPAWFLGGGRARAAEKVA